MMAIFIIYLLSKQYIFSIYLDSGDWIMENICVFKLDF